MPCLEQLDWLDALKRCIVKDSDGNYYLQVNYEDIPDSCDDIEPAQDCVSDMSIEELFKNTLVEGSCDDTCAINLMGNVCDVCVPQ